MKKENPMSISSSKCQAAWYKNKHTTYLPIAHYPSAILSFLLQMQSSKAATKLARSPYRRRVASNSVVLFLDLGSALAIPGL